MKFFKILIILGLPFGLFQCTEESLALEISCQVTDESRWGWNEKVQSMVQLSEKKDETSSDAPKDVKLVGIGTPGFGVITNNAKMKLVMIKNDPDNRNFQFFEKSPLGTPNLWSLYPPQTSAFKKKQSQALLVRFRTYRDGLPYTRMTFYQCK